MIPVFWPFHDHFVSFSRKEYIDHFYDTGFPLSKVST